MSDPALARIRTFSRYTWIVGAVGVMVAAFFVVPNITLLGDGVVVAGGNGGYGERINPYYEDDPVELTMADGVIPGDRQGGWMTFDKDSEPLELRRPASHDDTDHYGNDYISVYQTPGAPGEHPARDGLPMLGSLWDSEDVVYATPALTDSRLWFGAIDDEWQVLAEPVRSTAIVDGVAEGSGDEMLSYRGDALSARFTHTGSGYLRVTAFSPEFEYRGEPHVNDVDDFTTRASWPVPGTVLFRIESSGGEWSVTVDE
ncbi:hypothetical protein WDU99_01055 [Microbacterium sp. Mu-80]|uniref:Uncharacterized protein n=1 Tax=Microbacterium bandirmense TaxID=3122050 RepID=A0ABU8L7Y2_9MICO